MNQLIRTTAALLFTAALSSAAMAGVNEGKAYIVEMMSTRAQAGDAKAQKILGEMYLNGRYMPKDAAMAVEWYQKAAAQGHADAQYELGVMYANGKDVPKDNIKAAEWFQKAAIQGYAPAREKLDYMHKNGGVEMSQTPFSPPNLKNLNGVNGGFKVKTGGGFLENLGTFALASFLLILAMVFAIFWLVGKLGYSLLRWSLSSPWNFGILSGTLSGLYDSYKAGKERTIYVWRRPRIMERARKIASYKRKIEKNS
jgi:hypothetical protein